MEKIIGKTHQTFPVSDPSQVGDLRRAVKALALAHGLPSEATARAEIVVTELGTNLNKHTNKGGEILIGLLNVDDIFGVEILSLDQGPGMADPAKMLQDGVSTSGTLGGGLGAIKRLSDEFDIHSEAGRGTAILSRFWTNRNYQRCAPIDVMCGGVIVAMPGEEVAGDLWAVRTLGGRTRVVVADGLGHGRKAAEAAEESVRVLFTDKSGGPGELLRRMHETMQMTQGAVVAIADLDGRGELITYSGLGNISGRVYTPAGSKGCVSMPGGAGFQLHRIQEFSYSWPKRAMLVMSSDGLKSAINAQGLTQYHPSLIAAILYRDFHRGTDDATVVVARHVQEG